MKYRKRPIVIEATQWFRHGDHPRVVQGPYLYVASPQRGVIDTLEGEMQVTAGDWIITGVNGEVYPCKPDIFEKTYEAVA